MINLQALEEKLNKVLETETKESLTTWLLQKSMRHNNLNFTEIRIKVSDIPASVDELVINQKYKNERGR